LQEKDTQTPKEMSQKELEAKTEVSRKIILLHSYCEPEKQKHAYDSTVCCYRLNDLDGNATANKWQKLANLGL